MGRKREVVPRPKPWPKVGRFKCMACDYRVTARNIDGAVCPECGVDPPQWWRLKERDDDPMDGTIPRPKPVK